GGLEARRWVWSGADEGRAVDQYVHDRAGGVAVGVGRDEEGRHRAVHVEQLRAAAGQRETDRAGDEQADRQRVDQERLRLGLTGHRQRFGALNVGGVELEQGGAVDVQAELLDLLVPV